MIMVQSLCMLMLENTVLKSAKQRMLPHKNKFKDEIDFIGFITFTRGEHEPKELWLIYVNLYKIIIIIL